MQLTNNFSKSEFECKCGCEMPEDVFNNVKELAEQLQIIRNKVNKPIKINSSYRCESHNKKIGGSKNSQHKLGKASDIVIKGFTPKEVFILIDVMMDTGELRKGGLSAYDTFTHFDIRGYKARW